ncbi:DUF1329 domain-containing protein [Oleomonas cavernae]|uniref:DUF1329 domain-containing protein n=2 Tax=Oleomonas cavernae TaxID=2320859 RepID=A0A418WH58_9PROT|nr:DUF1329 domain-containing protein [Oleomonas cavernae]RJF89209.1 DUF1329 domain-containing protein [Oleomonas cavernae]
MASIRGRVVKSIMRRSDPMGLGAGLTPATISKARRRLDGMSWLAKLYRVRVAPVTAGSVPAEWVVPGGAKDQRVILYIHGGAWCLGSPKASRGFAASIASVCRTRVLSVGYRLAPENPFPAGLCDCIEAYRWLVNVQGVSPNNIIVLGDSSGGNLALALLVALRREADPVPAGAVVLSPPTDLARTGASHKAMAKKDALFSRLSEAGIEEIAKNYVGDHDRTDPLISPLYADLSGLPRSSCMWGKRRFCSTIPSALPGVPARQGPTPRSLCGRKCSISSTCLRQSCRKPALPSRVSQTSSPNSGRQGQIAGKFTHPSSNRVLCAPNAARCRQRLACLPKNSMGREMKILSYTLGLILAVTTAGQVQAKVSQVEAARLETDLTPLGGIRAGNADGSIPPWTGGLTVPPAGYEPGRHMINPYPQDKPEFTITSVNLDRYKDKLSAGQQALLKLYPTYKLPIYETRRSCALPERVYEANKRNALTATMTEDNNGLNDALLGSPFPVPQSGAEVIWNHRLRYRGFKFRRYFAASLVNRDGSYDLIRGKDFGIFHYSGPGIGQIGDVTDIKQLKNVFVSYLNFITYPPRSAGSIVLVLDTINAKELPRQAWLYNPGTRRVLKAPDIAYDNPAPQTDGLAPADTFDIYNGATDRYTFDMKPMKEMYIGYNAYELISGKQKYSDLIRPNHLNQDFSRYELHRTFVVDAKLKEGSRHVYGRRVFYVDEDGFNIALVDVYDTRGALWRLQDGPVVSYYEIPMCSSALELAHDLQSGKYLVFGLKGEERPSESNPSGIDNSMFTPDAIRRLGAQ